MSLINQLYEPLKAHLHSTAPPKQDSENSWICLSYGSAERSVVFVPGKGQAIMWRLQPWVCLWTYVLIMQNNRK